MIKFNNVERKSTPSHKKIVEYWSSKISEADIGIDWEDGDKRCWRCSYKPTSAKLEKCHIIPHALGGDEKCDNLVLLCKQCHKEAPNINDKESMWFWIKSGNSISMGFYDLYWNMRGICEYKELFGSDLEDDLLNKTNINYNDISSFLNECKLEMANGIITDSTPLPNPSTLAFFWRRMIRKKLKDGIELKDEINKTKLLKCFGFKETDDKKKIEPDG